MTLLVAAVKACRSLSRRSDDMLPAVLLRVSCTITSRAPVSCRLNAGVKLAVEIASIEDLSPLIIVSKTTK